MTTNDIYNIAVDDRHIPIHMEHSQDEELEENRLLYKRRWGILSMYAFATFVNAAIWITFAPISTELSHFFNTSESNIDLLSSLFIITFIPGLLLSLFISRAYGIGSSYKVGSLLMAVGTLFRMGSWFVHAGQQFSTFYALLAIGQTICGLSQPLLTTLSSQIAQQWFAPSEMTFALFIGSLANPLGLALGAYLSKALITNSTTISQGFDAVLLIQLCACAVILLTGVVFFDDAPPTPPSNIARSLSPTDHTTSGQGNVDDLPYHKFVLEVFKPIWSDIKALFRGNENNFLKLCVCFGLGMMLFNILVSLPAKIITPCNFQYNTGNMLMIVILAGLVGCVVYSVLLEITKQFKLFFKIGYLLAAVSFITFLVVLHDNISSAGLTTLFIVLGVFMIPLLPVTLENAQEMSYPKAPPQIISAIVLACGQLPSTVGLFVFMKLLTMEDYVSCKSPASSTFSIVIIVLLLLVVLIAATYNGEHRRTNAKNVLQCGDYMELPPEDALETTRLLAQTRNNNNNNNTNNNNQQQYNNNNDPQQTNDDEEFDDYGLQSLDIDIDLDGDIDNNQTITQAPTTATTTAVSNSALQEEHAIISDIDEIQYDAQIL